MTFPELKTLKNRTILDCHRTSIMDHRTISRGHYEVTLRNPEGVVLTTSDYHEAAAFVGTPDGEQDPALPPVLHELATSLLAVNRPLSAAHKAGLLTADEEEFLAESLAGMHLKVQEIQSRVMGRDYDSLVEAHLV